MDNAAFGGGWKDKKMAKKKLIPAEIDYLKGRSGVLIITRKETGEAYVGTSQNLYGSYSSYSTCARTVPLENWQPIRIAIHELGWEAFTFEWELCDVDKLIETANQWRDKLDSVENGYNRRTSAARSDEYFSRNQEGDMCTKCGKEEVEVTDINGGKIVRKLCSNCIRKDVAKRARDNYVPSEKIRKKREATKVPMPVITEPTNVPMPVVPTKAPVAVNAPQVIAKTPEPTPSVITPPPAPQVADKWSSTDKTRLACVLAVCATAIACSAIIF